MKSILIILIAISSHFVGYTQNYGYMGKHWTSELNFPFMLTFADHTHLNIYPEINLNYTISRRVDIGFSSSIDIAKISDPGFEIHQSNNYNWDMSKSQNYEYIKYVPEKENYHLMIVGLDFQIRIYGRKYIAPLGVYHQFNFGKYWMKNIDASHNNYIGTNEDSGETSLLSIKNRYSDTWKIGYTLGRKIGFKNKNYITIAFNPNVIIGFKPHLMDYLDNSAIYNDYLPKKQNSFNSVEYMFQYKIGIGRFL